MDMHPFRPLWFAHATDSHNKKFEGGEMPARWITIPAEEGRSFEGYLSVPESGGGPGLVLIQEIFGVNSSIRGACDYFAGEGFTTLAPDLFWRFEPRLEIPFDEDGRKKAFGLHNAYDYELGVTDIASALAALKAQPECQGPVGVTGFCMGGTFAYLAATRLGVDMAAGYYGTKIAQNLDEAPKVSCPLLLHFGEEDHTTPPDVIEAIRKALGGDPKVDIEVYPGASHAFANPERPSYDPDATALAHERTLALFRHVAGAS
jgi:carboxymethylenebutenolidase